MSKSAVMNIMKKTTCSTLFLIRFVGMDTRVIRPLGFVNAYMGDKNEDIIHYDKAVYMLFKSSSSYIEDFLGEQRESPLYLQEYYYEGNYIVLVMKIPEKFLPDYELFLQGKYSEFSTELKENFPLKHSAYKEFNIEQDSFFNLIFNKSETLKEFWEDQLDVKLDKNAEVWTAPDLRGKELLDIHKMGEFLTV